MHHRVKKELVSWIRDIVFAFIIVVLLNSFVIVNARVPSGSMENTIMPKNRLFAFRLSYIFDKPQRGDIIIFKYPDNEKEKFVKRIIGLPGEEVKIDKTDVYIDGQLLDENYLKEPMNRNNDFIFNVPQGAYFVMGDNRNMSWDSRNWKNTFVDKSKILGKVVLKYYPKIEIMTNK